ncbi:ACYPI003889 protein [Aphis craccivora]|uniref:ACYPI003889 protein n=1 Tax=Aphis craccivora TaxID=307492 RepID=A0A6G0YLW6_APHCR|nr:ACYPI003889 protein [Aphis craccivora]
MMSECACLSVYVLQEEGMYFTKPSEMNDYKYSKTASMLGKLVHVIRIFGVFTAIVMFGVGVDITIHHHEFGLYIIKNVEQHNKLQKNVNIIHSFFLVFFRLMALLVFFLEITWAITLFLNVCINVQKVIT